MVSRVVKVLDTSDVAFMGLQAAKLSGSGIGIGLQSKEHPSFIRRICIR